MPPHSLAEPWESAARMAAWAPDDARELLAEAVHDDTDDVALARTSELMAKAFAITGAWELAQSSYALAAESWQAHDASRAFALGELAKRLPLAPFTRDDEAIAAERLLVDRMLGADAPPPLLLRAITEIRRALAPRPITGRIEAACGLAPMESALVLALAVAPAACRGLMLDDWHARLVPSQWYAAGLDRVIELGLVEAAPALAAHPRLVSRLAGRTAIEMPRGLRLERIAASGTPPPGAHRLASAMLAGGIARVAPGTLPLAAQLVAARGLALLAVHPIAGDPSELLAEAAIEVRAHGAVLAVELDDWPLAPYELIARLAPVVVVCRDDAAFADDRRAFTLRWGVSSPR